MLTLQRKIFIWLCPLALAMLLFAYGYYKARENVIIDHILQTTRLATAVGVGELDHYLALRHSEFKLLSATMDSCSNSQKTISENAHMALRYTRGFSALVTSDIQGSITHVELSANQSNQHILRHDVIGAEAFDQLDFLELQHRYDEWIHQLPKLKQKERVDQEEHLLLKKRGETNSIRFREIEQEMYELRDRLSSPPGVTSIGGYQLARSIGLPFASDTFLFSKPMIDCNNQLKGFYSAFLDRTQLEDRLFSIKQYLQENGLERVDVALLDNNGQRFITETRLVNESQVQSAFNPITKEPEIRDDLQGIILSRVIGYSTRLMNDSHIHENSERFHSLAEKVWAERSQGISLLVYVSDEEIKLLCNQLKREVILWAVMLLVFFAVLVILLSRHIVLPISQLTEHVLALAEGKRHDLASVAQRTDEIGLLSKSFDKMSEAIEAKEKNLVDMASHDPLTGCYNRRAMFSVAREELLRASRSGIKLSVCMLDLDHFKRINDHFGHQVGDQVLREFSGVVTNNLRVEDKFGRIGGEEFALLLVGAELEEAMEIAERIRTATERITVPGFENEELTVTVSIGLSEWAEIEPFEQALSRADEKLYKAKRAGRNLVEG